MRGSQRQPFHKSFTSKTEHDILVAELCKKMRGFDRSAQDDCRKRKVLYNSPSDVPSLNKIVAIDLLTSSVKVEANMTMEALVEAILPFGFLPSVVAGERTTTVSDAFAALTSESSSYAFGTFDCTVTEIEVILGDGRLVYARPDNPLTADLFYGSAGGLNSLGLTTALEVCLVRAGPYVELVLQPATGVLDSKLTTSEPRVLSGESAGHSPDTTDTEESDTVCAMEEAEQMHTNDFVEAMLFQGSSGVIITGHFSPVASHPTVRTTQDYVRLVASVWHTQVRIERSMPTLSYLFRNMKYQALRQTDNGQFALCNEGITTPGDTERAKLQSYGLPRNEVGKFLQTTDVVPVLVRTVIQAKDVGRRLSLGVGCPFDIEVNLCVSSRYCQDVIEKALLRDRTPRGFPYLQCRAPCQPEAAWILHNDRWHLKPWLFHNDQWYVELRQKWNSKAIADISDRVACKNPLRLANLA